VVGAAEGARSCRRNVLLAVDPERFGPLDPRTGDAPVGADGDPVSMRQLSSSRSAASVLLVVTGVLLLCAVEFTFHLNHAFRHVLNEWFYNNVMLAAGAACIVRGVVHRRDRLAWILVGTAVAAWGIGDTIWTFTVASDPSPPFPSVADIGFLAVYPPAYVAIVLLLRSRTGTVRGSLWLDGVIGGLTVAALGTAVVFQAVVDALGGSQPAVATNLAYPLADLTLIAIVVWSLAITGWRPDRTWALLASGLLVFSISDCVYLYQTATGSYVQGSPADLGWIAGGVLLAWAAWQPQRRRAQAKVEGWGLLFAPVGFGVVALGVLVYDHSHRVNPLSLTLAGAAILAVIARMAMTFGENLQMIAHSRGEARTDVVTGLGNRRRLYDDLGAALKDPDANFVLGLYDLNGFKLYNDSFGHLAGDALLARLGGNLSQFVGGRGHAYRMGGDEFCIVVRNATEAELVVAGAATALAEHGEGFAISAAYGAVLLPDEANDPQDALRLADQRMYENKQGARLTASEQSSGVLLRALSERHPNLGAHSAGVAELAEAVAGQLGLPDQEAARARLAGALHEVGKMAIPDVILEKPGPLTDDEWNFVRGHTLIGERILHTATALRYVAGLVRSTHERFDGTGYPDGLAGTDSPLVSRIVLVCDAFGAMTSQRPYADALTIDAALAELQRNAGTQFDPIVVAALADVLADRGAPRIALAS
jgi:two-component system, cell cycle response regulator